MAGNNTTPRREPQCAQTPSPRRPQSAQSTRQTHFHGIVRTPLPRSEIIMTPPAAQPPVSASSCRSPFPRGVATQREVALEVRERLLNMERKKQFGASSLTRPRFLVSKRIDPQPPSAPPTAAAIPAAPQHPVRPSSAKTASTACTATASAAAPSLALGTAAASVAASTPSLRPSFQISRRRRTMFDIQVNAARTESLQHTEPFVAVRPFARILRMPEDEAKEYVETELEAGYYKRWVHNVEGQRPAVPPSVEHFFGSREAFETQDDVAMKAWRERILAVGGAWDAEQHTLSSQRHRNQ